MKERHRNNWTRAGLAILAMTIAAAGLAACTAPGAAGSVVVKAESPRLPALPLDGAAAGDLVAGNTQFALDLYRALWSDEENLFYSPHSLSAALAMVYAGARGETEDQMARALHFNLAQDQLHAAFNALEGALAGRDEGQQESALRLEAANALWGPEDHRFLRAFLDTLAGYYGAGLRTVDFGQVEEARRIINRWASDQTAQGVEELLPPGSVDAETALVVTNAVHFQAAWMYAFAADPAGQGAFALPDGGQVTVPMMEQIAPLGYAQRPGLQAVELPYANGELSMVVLLPEAGGLEALARELDAGTLQSILDDMQTAQVRLAMPSFRIDASFTLKDTLMALGMVDAFGDANFSGIDGTHELFIKEVYHGASVSVDEAGTEASAASAVVVKRKGAPDADQVLRLDRPFLFLIRDVETGAVLFLGHVVNPAT